jgi:hypothetical protein
MLPGARSVRPPARIAKEKGCGAPYPETELRQPHHGLTDSWTVVTQVHPRLCMRAVIRILGMYPILSFVDLPTMSDVNAAEIQVLPVPLVSPVVEPGQEINLVSAVGYATDDSFLAGPLEQLGPRDEHQAVGAQVEWRRHLL